MAAKSTIFKAGLQIADMDRHHYEQYSLTLARHPSETDERMMVRLLAFALNADESLQFGQGMTNDEEADLWQKDLTGTIERWIDVGTPDERLIRKACGRSQQVIVYTYGGRTADLWFSQNSPQLARHRNLRIYSIDPESSNALAALANRTMDLQCLIQDGGVSLSDTKNSVEVRMLEMTA